MIKEHDHVILTVDLPEHRLVVGDAGIVVMIHRDHAAYELEFLTAIGNTVAVVTVEAAQVRPVTRRDVLHARTLEPAD